MADFNLIIGIIGALAWFSPILYESIKKPKLFGTLLQHHINSNSEFTYFNRYGAEEKIYGLQHILKLSITAINRSKTIDYVEVYVKYINDPIKYKGEIVWSKEIITHLPDRDMKISIPPESDITSFSIFEKDKSYIVYMSFIIDRKQMSEYERIEIKVYDHRKKCSTLYFDQDSINYKSIKPDEDIWTTII